MIYLIEYIGKINAIIIKISIRGYFVKMCIHKRGMTYNAIPKKLSLDFPAPKSGYMAMDSGTTVL